MKRGTKEKPLELKVIEGVTDKQRIPDSCMDPDSSMPHVPEWITGYARTIWVRLAKELNRIGVLRFTDRDMFAAYCQTIAEYRNAIRDGSTAKQIKLLPQMRALASEFGLTPSSRSSIHSSKPKGNNESKSKADVLIGGNG